MKTVPATPQKTKNPLLQKWREDFERDPLSALAEIFSGRAMLSSVSALGTHEFLAQEFASSDRIERLDGAMQKWLTDMLENERHAKRLGAAVYARRLCDALITVWRMKLPRTTSSLREKQGEYQAYLKRWRISQERDPARELERALEA